MSAVTDALDRMDFWSRELALHLYLTIDGRRYEPPHRLPDDLEAAATRIHTVVAVSQFQAAQEAAKEATL
jgi:hypothetical protein